MLDINKQKMKYALQGQTVTIEETDEFGNPVYEGYTDASGNFIPYLDSQGNSFRLRLFFRLYILLYIRCFQPI